MTGSDSESLVHEGVTPERFTRLRIAAALGAIACVSCLAILAKPDIVRYTVVAQTDEITELSEIPGMIWETHENSYLSGWAGGFGGGNNWVPEQLAKDACAVNSHCKGITCKDGKCSLRGSASPRHSSTETSYIKKPAPPPYTARHVHKEYSEYASCAGGRGHIFGPENAQQDAKKACDADPTCLGISCEDNLRVGWRCWTGKGHIKGGNGVQTWPKLR